MITSVKKCVLATFAVTALATLILLASCASQNDDQKVNQEPATSPATAQAAQQKYLAVNNTVTVNALIFEPLLHRSFCDGLGEVIGQTDGGLQVFAIEGQEPEHFICIIVDGREIICQNKADNPILFSNLDLNEIEIKTDDTIEGNGQVLADEATLLTIKGYLVDGTPIDLPDLASAYARLEFSSANYPGIKLELLLIHDELGNCYIYDEEARQTWSIGHELMEYIEEPH